MPRSRRGAVPPTGRADALLRGDVLVLGLPGGLRESMKPRELRYRLLWGTGGRRYGFVEAAIRNRAPPVPIACVGGDDRFDLVGDSFERGRRWHLPGADPARGGLAVERSLLR